MSKYGADGQGNYFRKNEYAATKTLTLNTSGIGNVSVSYGQRFRTAPVVVVQAYTTFSTYCGLTVVSSNQRFVDVKSCLVGNVSGSYTLGILAIDANAWP